MLSFQFCLSKYYVTIKYVYINSMSTIYMCSIYIIYVIHMKYMPFTYYIMIYMLYTMQNSQCVFYYIFYI